VGFAAKRELRGLAGLGVLGLKAFPGLAVAAALREIEGVFQAAFNAETRVDAFLDGDFLGLAFVLKTAGAGVKAFVVFANDNEIDMLRALVFERAIFGAIETHRAQ